MKKKTSKNALRTFFKVMKYLKLYKLHFILSLIFTAASVILTLYVPILIGDAIDLAVRALTDHLAALHRHAAVGLGNRHHLREARHLEDLIDLGIDVADGHIADSFSQLQ